MKKLFVFLSVLVLLLGAAYGTYRLTKSRTFQLFGQIIHRVDTDEKLVALTFDDGPTQKTDEIIDLLDELSVRATFFVTGEALESGLIEGRKLANAGHELGNHSYSHQRMLFRSLSFMEDEINRTNELIRETGYTGDIHFRPPYCKKFVLLPYYLDQIKMKTITCDIEPETLLGYKTTADELSQYTIENAKEGSIILLHIMFDRQEEAFEAVKPIVEGLRAKGYQFVTVSELLSGDNDSDS